MKSDSGPNITRLLIALIAAALLVISCGEKECPLCPEPPGPPDTTLVDLNFYLTDDNTQNHHVYVYNTSARGFVDSVNYYTLWHTNIEVTAGEEYLILSRSWKTHIFDLRSKLWLPTLEIGGEVEVSRNGKYVAIQSADFHILDATTFEIILVDSGGTHGGNFDLSGEMFVGVRSGNVLRRYDLANDTILPDIAWTYNGEPGPYVQEVIPVGNGEKLFMQLRYGNNFRRVVSYRFDNDSTGFHYWTGTLKSNFALTPDGKTLIFDDPRNFDSFMPLTTGAVFFVDVESEVVTDIVPPPWFDGRGEKRHSADPDEIAMSPDGSLCLFGSARTSYSNGEVFLMTVQDRSFRLVDTSGYARDAAPKSVACRKRE